MDLLDKVFPLVKNYIDSKGPVVQYLDPEEMRKRVLDLSNTGDVVKFIEFYLKYSVRTGSKQFLNQLYQGFTPSGFVGEIITSLTNTSMYTYEVAPVATIIEQEVIKKMTNIIGFSDGDGLFVTGGSNANLVALLTARNTLFPQSKVKGIREDLVLFVSEEAHYSFGKAANIIGLGLEAVVKIKTDSFGRMDVTDLRTKIKENISSGKKPFFIGATAGTTVKGAFDPLKDIYKVAEEFSLWLHVDGAFGGSVVLSEKHKLLVDGLELADSMTWNPHKMMGVPLICSTILLKKKGLLAASASSDHGGYLFHGESNDLGEKSLQCGRRVDALKLWLAWMHYGDTYGEKIDNLFSLASYAAEIVEKHPDMELLAPVQSVAICFRYKQGDEYTRMVRERLLRKGSSVVNYAHIDGKLGIRLVLINLDLTKEDIDTFFTHLEASR